MLTPTDIIENGERHVAAYLTSTGYHCTMSKPHHGGADIEARGEEDNLIVHVMSVIQPSEVPDISTTDRARTISRAMTLGYDAWLAKVVIDNTGELAQDIAWEQLNH